MLLTAVSHELRSPLARIRVATELLGEAEGKRPELLERVSADISVLDGLIGELLLAARLDTLEAVERTAEIDLLAARSGGRVGIRGGCKRRDCHHTRRRGLLRRPHAKPAIQCAPLRGWHSGRGERPRRHTR